MKYKVSLTCLVLVLGMCTVQVAKGQLITGVEQRNSGSAAPQVVTEGLEEGVLIFTDRTYQYRDIPEFLLGAEYVMLGNNDKTSASYELDLTFARPVTLYLFVDNRVGDDNVDDPASPGAGVMSWMAGLGFESTYELIGVDEHGVGMPDGWSTIFKLDAPAGTITLHEQNDGGSRRMYGIAVWAASLAAEDPMPEPGDVNVPLRAMLSWKPGVDASAHDVYLGTVFDDVNEASRSNPLGVLISEGQDANAYDPTGLLAYGETYYWRVDEMAADGTFTKGSVWQFDVEPVGYPIDGDVIVATASSSQVDNGPENTVNGSGLEDDGHGTSLADMWQSEFGADEPVWIQYAFDKIYKLHALKVWNYNGDLEHIVGFGLKDVTVEHSLDGISWTALGDYVFEQGTSMSGYTANTTVDFEGVVAQYVRLVVNSSWGTYGRHGLSEVRFLYTPTYPRQPDPASGASDVPVDVVLNWRAGRDAASHDIHLSTDEQAVLTGTALIDTVGESAYPLSGLELGTTYYWKIDEINEAESVILWEGPVWSFTMQESYVVDDFESYTDNEDENLTIWQTWIDGIGKSDNGSQVGHNDLPYAERNIVREGRQSMPLYYSNGASATYSQATRTFETPQDWTRSGAQFLMLSFRGVATNTTGQMYVEINGVKVPYDGNASDLTKTFWIPWVIDLATVGTDLTNVQTLTVGVENSGIGRLYVDGIALYRVAPEPAQEEVWIEAEAADTILWPMRIYAEQEGASGGEYIATFGDASSDNPPDNGVASYTVELSGGTYRIIGRTLAATGNDDSFWVRLDGATTNTANHVSDWVRWGLEIGDDWQEVPVRSMDDEDATVLFTVEPGIYNLEIAFREDGALLDKWIITQTLE